MLIRFLLQECILAFSSKKASVLQQLQTCLQPAINALISDQVFTKEAVANVSNILKEMNDPELASEILYDMVIDKARSDPRIVGKFWKSVGKVNSTVCNLHSRLTWQQLKQNRSGVVEINISVIDACVKKGIITQEQHKALMAAKQRRESEFVANKFFDMLEKLSEYDEGSQLAEFEKILKDKQPEVLKVLLKAGKSIQHGIRFLALLYKSNCLEQILKQLILMPVVTLFVVRYQQFLFRQIKGTVGTISLIRCLLLCRLQVAWVAYP